MKLKSCAECGAPVRYRDRRRCCRCWRRQRAEAAKAICPDCAQRRVLRPDTGRCEVCSRRCMDCGAVVRRRDRDRCTRCHHRREREAAKRECPRCGQRGFLRERTGWCGPCSHPGGAKKPPVRCAVCGQVRRHAGLGMCGRCWQRHPGRPFAAVANLIDRLDEAPTWLPEFAAHVAARHCPARACHLITGLGRLLADGGPAHPQALLERSRLPGRSMGTLARALEDFLVERGLALPVDQAERLAAGRRRRRLDAVPAPLRPAVARFAKAGLTAQQRARRAGTRPRKDGTVEKHLAVVRDLAVFLLAERGKRDWATADVGDIEAFLRVAPANRRHRLAALRQFFAWARANRVVLVDPTGGLTAREPRGYRGPVLTVAQQRALFRRWTGDPAAHPHEALVGLLAVLHGATNAELRALTVADIDSARRVVQLGSRPHPTPLDPSSWAALDRCLPHRLATGGGNPHVLVTKGTKATRAPASVAYVAHVLDPAGVNPRALRGTRLVDLVACHDPKLVAAAFGMRPEGVLPYLADTVDADRLPNP